MAGAKTGPNWFAITIASVTVLALVGVGALVFMLNRSVSGPGEIPSADIVDAETGAISFGDGPDTVAVYLDFMCPGCGSFEAQYGEALKQASGDGTITLEVHPIAIQDNLSQGTRFSSRAGSALYCVAEHAPDVAQDFQLLMFANQPQQNSRGLSNDDIVAIAEASGAGEAASCIRAGTYAKYVLERTPHTPAGPDGRISTPTVVVNGERLPFEEIPTRLGELLG